jgi:hypothetical protein
MHRVLMTLRAMIKSYMMTIVPAFPAKDLFWVNRQSGRHRWRGGDGSETRWRC